MAENKLRMQHEIQRSEGVMYFYEGEVPVAEGGVVEIPLGESYSEDWVRRAYLNGYTLDPDNDSEPFGDVDTALSGSRKGSRRKSAKSEKETNEGSDSGRQSNEGAGVREG